MCWNWFYSVNPPSINSNTNTCAHWTSLLVSGYICILLLYSAHIPQRCNLQQLLVIATTLPMQLWVAYITHNKQMRQTNNQTNTTKICNNYRLSKRTLVSRHLCFNGSQHMTRCDHIGSINFGQYCLLCPISWGFHSEGIAIIFVGQAQRQDRKLWQYVSSCITTNSFIATRLAAHTQPSYWHQKTTS